MARIALFTHLPRLRIEGSGGPIGAGLLTKMPWDQYDAITLGAYSEWKDRYVAADPVFFWAEVDIDLPIVRDGRPPGGRMSEMKLPRSAWDRFLPDLGLGVMSAFHKRMVDPVRAALMLVAPATAPPDPRISVTVLGALEEIHFELAGERCAGLRAQGEADQAYLFSPRSAGRPLAADDLGRAASLVKAVSSSLEGAQMGPSLRQLLATAEPALSHLDRLTLAVSALEAMLLPEIRSGLGDTFGRRVSNLLGGTDTQVIARDLYRARSASVHGGSSSRAFESLPPACAEQFLAACIFAAGRAVGRGMRLEALRTRLDEGPLEPTEHLGAVPADDPPGLAPDERLLVSEPWWSGTFTEDVALGAPDGVIASWSPLVGLGFDGEALGVRGLGASLVELSGREVTSMEDKDLRRDFIRTVSIDSEPVAGLLVLEPGPLALDYSQVAPILRRRDLAVLGLRLEGFDAFVDPEFYGWSIFDGGNMRHRSETAFGQSVLMDMRLKPQQRVGPYDEDRLDASWGLLSTYDAGGANDEIELALGLFRRGHDRKFTPPETRATILLGLLESLLGRFRPHGEKIQLEDLVTALGGVDPAAARWLATDGRAFRNEVAHGAWCPEALGDDPDVAQEHLALAHLLAIGRAGLRECLEQWNALPRPKRARARPSRVLIDAIRDRVSG